MLFQPHRLDCWQLDSHLALYSLPISWKPCKKTMIPYADRVNSHWGMLSFSFLLYCSDCSSHNAPILCLWIAHSRTKTLEMHCIRDNVRQCGSSFWGLEELNWWWFVLTCYSDEHALQKTARSIYIIFFPRCRKLCIHYLKYNSPLKLPSSTADGEGERGSGVRSRSMTA